MMWRYPEPTESLPSDAIVRVHGDLDVVSGSHLRDRLETLVAAGFRQIGVDLSEVRFIDSSGIAVLLLAARHLWYRQGELIITACSPSVMRVLKTLALSQ